MGYIYSSPAFQYNKIVRKKTIKIEGSFVLLIPAPILSTGCRYFNCWSNDMKRKRSIKTQPCGSSACIRNITLLVTTSIMMVDNVMRLIYYSVNKILLLRFIYGRRSPHCDPRSYINPLICDVFQRNSPPEFCVSSLFDVRF